MVIQTVGQAEGDAVELGADACEVAYFRVAPENIGILPVIVIEGQVEG